MTTLTVAAGPGGPTAHTWVGSLLAMYLRCAARRGWSIEVASVERAADGGLAKVRLQLPDDADLAPEHGHHRLTAPSPFDPTRRQLAFATVAVDEAPVPRDAPTRDYVLTAPTKVVDGRTGTETADVDAVLDGDLSFVA